MENAEEVDFDNAAEGELDEQIESVDDAITTPAGDAEEEEGSRKRKRDETLDGNKRLKFSILESQEALTVDGKIAHVLRNSKNNRLKVDDIQKKLKKRVWSRFYDKFKLEVSELLELLGTKYTFEIVQNETWVVLNEQFVMQPVVFPPMHPFMCPPAVFPPFGGPPFMPPFFGGQALNKQNTTMCEVCRIELNSESVRESHYAGKKHLRRAAEMEETKKKHEAAMGDQQPGLFPDGAFGRPSKGKDDFFPYSCQICNVEINSKKTEELHMKGKKHKRRLLERQTGSSLQQRSAIRKNKSGFAPYTCTFCRVSITSAQMEEDHNKGKKHIKRIQLAMQNPYSGPGGPTKAKCPEVPVDNN